MSIVLNHGNQALIDEPRPAAAATTAERLAGFPTITFTGRNAVAQMIQFFEVPPLGEPPDAHPYADIAGIELLDNGDVRVSVHPAQKTSTPTTDRGAL